MAMRIAAWLLAGIVFATSAAAADEAPIASGPQSDGGKARLDVISAKRTEGETLTIRFRLVNTNGNSDIAMTLGNMALIDLVNRRSYEAGLSSSCRAKAGKTVTCWAVFAAPPADLKAITMKAYEDFELISVPLGS